MDAMDNTPLKGRVALVTGAGRNIGRAIALAFAGAGAKVAVNVRASRDEGQAVVDEIVAHGGDALLVAADVTQRSDVDAMIAAIAKRFGRLDIVVNNAAIRHEVAFANLPYADWRSAQAVCVDGAFHCTQAALPLLRESGAGTVVNIGGLTAYTGASKRAHVVTAKAALGGFTRALAHELAPFGITVNCVSPGLIDTVRNTGSATGTPAHHASHQTLLGRRGRPDEVASAVVWLAGPGGRYITGQTLHVNGGAYLGG
jgi:3-oxoacyl-[acyl-carrier protein] reductase